MTGEIQNMMSGQDCAKTLDGVKVNLLRENVQHEYANHDKTFIGQVIKRGINASNWQKQKIMRVPQKA